MTHVFADRCKMATHRPRLSTLARKSALLVIGAAAGLTMAAPSISQARPAPRSFADLAAKVTPAVVNIATERVRRVARLSKRFRTPNRRGFRAPDGSPFEEFFRRRFGQTPGQRPGQWRGRDVPSRSSPHVRPQKARSVGSGFIIDPNGYVVTNNHVIARATKIEVIMQDGTRYIAKLVGRDPKTDLALLKIKADKPLPHVEFGDSTKARVGDWVMAVGNPFGLGGTVTAGIISARGRNIGRRTIVNYLQIDAPINKGNSGGPTFNMDGKVIGVNTAIYSPNGGNVGLGFAVPASTAKSVINQLRAKGKISRGWLGVQIQPVTKDIAQALRLKSRDGAMVVAVQPNSPAAKAGLKSGDVIRKWDSKAVKTVRDLVRKVANTPANKEVEVGVLRNGKIMTLTAKTKAPKASPHAASAVGPNGNKSFLPSGIKIADLNSNTRRQYRIKKSVHGVVIVAIKPSSAASRKRIRRGDVVTHAGGAPVANKAEVEAAFEAVRQEGREAILLRIVRNGRARFIGLPIK